MSYNSNAGFVIKYYDFCKTTSYEWIEFWVLRLNLATQHQQWSIVFEHNVIAEPIIRSSSPLVLSQILRFSFGGISSDFEGNILQIVSTLEGTLTAGPWIDHCLPDGNATIFIKGTRLPINLSLSAFRSDSSGGTLHNCIPFALACTGITQRFNALPHVIHTHSLPSLLIIIIIIILRWLP